MENNQVSQKSYSPSSGKYLIEKAHINSLDQYKEIYDRSIQDPEVFWSEIAERITWFKKWDQVCEYDFVNASVKWFEGATLNACYNCLDRHIEDGHGDDTALIWEGNNPSDDKTYTFNQLLTEVKKFSNVLKAQDIKKGDRVCLCRGGWRLRARLCRARLPQVHRNRPARHRDGRALQSHAAAAVEPAASADA